jgi:predicted NAD/FAD-binding protein
MQLKINFLCRDSILAAPIVLDVALFLDLAKRAGMSGIQEWLSFYFKSPMHAAGLYPEHDLFIQLMKLKNTLRFLKARTSSRTSASSTTTDVGQAAAGAPGRIVHRRPVDAAVRLPAQWLLLSVGDHRRRPDGVAAARAVAEPLTAGDAAITGLLAGVLARSSARCWARRSRSSWVPRRQTSWNR